MNNELEAWDRTKDLLGNYKTSFSDHWSFNFYNDPKRLAFVLSRYKFAAKMSCKGGAVLELGCSEGIGAPILVENMDSYTGIDYDPPAIATANLNLKPPKFNFGCTDFMNKKFGQFQSIVSLDVIEHILPEYEDDFLKTILLNLSKNGIVVIGTPNITSDIYASAASKQGHVNLYSQKRLLESLGKYFHYTVPFGMNDEIVHTGYAPMCHYLFVIAFEKKGA